MTANLEHYRLCIRQLLSDRAHLLGDDCIRAETVFDRARDRYLLVRVGWQGCKRIYDPVLHIDIQDGRVWIQHDGTTAGIANDLIARGIPERAIVRGFRAAVP